MPPTHTILTETVNDATIPPNLKLQELIRLAEMCVDLVQENNEYYAEVSVKNVRDLRPCQNVVSVDRCLSVSCSNVCLFIVCQSHLSSLTCLCPLVHVVCLVNASKTASTVNEFGECAQITLLPDKFLCDHHCHFSIYSCPQCPFSFLFVQTCFVVVTLLSRRKSPCGG